MEILLNILTIYVIIGFILILSNRIISPNVFDKYIANTFMVYIFIIFIFPYVFMAKFYSWNFINVESNKLGTHGNQK